MQHCCLWLDGPAPLTKELERKEKTVKCRLLNIYSKTCHFQIQLFKSYSRYNWELRFGHVLLN